MTLAHPAISPFVRPDLRKCPSPLCGGVFVQRVNHRTPRCNDGKMRPECHVAEVDISALGLEPDQEARILERIQSKVPAASDPEGRIAHSDDIALREASPGTKDGRGVEIDHGFAERTTFVVTPDGKIAATLGGLKPAENVEKSLETVQKLAARH